MRATPFSYRPLCALLFAGAWLAISACGDQAFEEGAEEGVELITIGQPVTRFAEVRSQVERGDFCQVEVKRFGRLDLEKTYLPKVVWCENREAPEASFEALKAQAIAARTYAFYRTYDYTAPGALDPGNGTGSQRDQSYDCGTPSGPSWERAQRAVTETSGQIFVNDSSGHLVWGCYASGAERNLNDPSCRALSNHYTERHITRNQGKAWGASGFKQTTLGGAQPGVAQYNNHGCMGQKEANCLASARDMSAAQILRHFYGGVRIEQLKASCFTGSGTALGFISGGLTPLSANASSCVSQTERPAIITRQQWGARSYRGAPASLGSPTRITFHHEGTSAVRTSGGADAMRAVQRFHQVNNGWDDVGYHYVIMPDGQIYEGRATYRPGQLALGAHAGGANSRNIGVMLYGNFNLQQPSSAQMASASQLASYLASEHDITLAKGSTLVGHRDVTSTSCPGTNLYNRLGQIASGAGAEQVCSLGGGGGASPREHLPTPDVSLPPTVYNALTLRGTQSSPFLLDQLEITRPDGTTVPFVFVEAMSQSITEADNTSCDASEAAFAFTRSDQVSISLLEAIEPGDTIHIRQHPEGAPPSGCALDGGLEVVAIPADANFDARRLVDDGRGNLEIPLIGSELVITSPMNHSALPQQGAQFEAVASEDVVKVEYFAELFPLGSSEAPGEDFRLPYDFSRTGRRIITAKGYDAAGTFVAFDQIELGVEAGAFALQGLREGGVYPPSLTFSATVNRSALEQKASELNVALSQLGVSCEADGFALPVSPSSVGALTWQGNQGTFTVTHLFNQLGSRDIQCHITANGAAALSTEAIGITVLEGASGLELLSPQHRGWYKRSNGIEFLARAIDPRITRVEYVIDGQWKVGDSSVIEDHFAYRYDFSHYGTRRIVAQGFSGDGMKLSEAEVYIILTDDQGMVPSGSADVINQRIPDDPTLVTPSVPVEPPVVTPTSSPNLNDRRQLACAIMAHHDAGRLTLLSSDPQGDNKGTAYANIQDTCNGGRASHSSRSHRGPIRVDLNTKVLKLVYDMPSSGYKYRINWFAGGRHGRTSQHYTGDAVDTGGIFAPSYAQLNNCTATSTVGQANRWIWNYGVANGSNQTLSQCGLVLPRVRSFNYLNHSTWAHSAWR